MALTNPFPFDLLRSRASARWAKWSASLVTGLQSLRVTVPEHGHLVATYDPSGTVLEIARPIPAIGLCRVGDGGIPARDGSTGQLSEATVTLYYRTYDPDTGDKFLVLGEEEAVLVNELAEAVPANVDVLYVEQGGELTVLGWTCEDA